jgi:quercetin dioxygenase-like cupin family protein
MSVFYDPENRASKDLLPGVHARTFWGEQVLLALVDLDANAVIPNHSHPHEQGGIVIKGEPEFTIAGEVKKLKPGDMYVIPGGVGHSVIVGPEPAQVLDIYSPVREEYKY